MNEDKNNVGEPNEPTPLSGTVRKVLGDTIDRSYDLAIDNAVKIIRMLKDKGWHDANTALEFAAEQVESLKSTSK